MTAVNQNLCDECGTCVSVCPKDAIVLTNKPTVLTERCVSCGICVSICPFGALSSNQETKL